MSSELSVIVVGAGIAGAALAFHFADAGADVTVVDDLAEGRATAAGAGIICPWATRSDDEDFVRLGIAATAYYPRLVERLSDPTSYRQVGALALPADDQRPEDVAERVLRRADDTAGAVEVLAASEAQRRFPPLRDGQAAVWIEGGARVDGERMRRALLAAAAARGARMVDGAAALIARDGAVDGVRVGDQQIKADATVLAAGTWSRALAAPAGLDVPVEPQRGQIVHLRVDAPTESWPVLLPAADHYLLAFDDQRVVVGATRETGSGHDPRVTAAGIAQVIGNALQVAPGLANATYLETRVGIRPMSPDPRPILGPTTVSGLHLLTGFGPSGLMLAPYAASLVADSLLGRDPDLTGCLLNRF